MDKIPPSLALTYGLAAIFMGLIAIFLTAAPFTLSTTALPAPALICCSAFFWLVRRPSSQPVLVIFLLGLTSDLALGTRLGSHALSLLLPALMMRGIVMEHRSWLAKWFTFLVFSFGVLALLWLTNSLSGLRLQPLKPFFLQWGVTAAAYLVWDSIWSRLFPVRQRSAYA